MQEVVLKIRYFEKGLPKSFKKVNFIFSPNPVPFNEKRYQKKRGLELVTSRSSGYEENKSRKIPLLVIYYLTKYDDVI